MMDIKVPKDKHTSADGLIERTSSMLDETKSKIIHRKIKKVIDRRKRSKILSEVKPVKNICKSPQRLLEVIPVKKGVLLSHKPQDHVYE